MVTKYTSFSSVPSQTFLWSSARKKSAALEKKALFDFDLNKSTQGHGKGQQT